VAPSPGKRQDTTCRKHNLVPLIIDEQVIGLADLFANRVEYVLPLDAFGSID
jgi:hypothetical protein